MVAAREQVAVKQTEPSRLIRLYLGETNLINKTASGDREHGLNLKQFWKICFITFSWSVSCSNQKPIHPSIHPSLSKALPLATAPPRAANPVAETPSPSLFSLSKAQQWLRDCNVVRAIQEAMGPTHWRSSGEQQRGRWGQGVCMESAVARGCSSPLSPLTMGLTDGCESKWLCWSVCLSPLR